MAKVIKNWKAGENPDENGVFIEIVGREAGILSWLMSLAGLDPTDRFIVKTDRIEFTSTSISGKNSITIPLSKVSSTMFGYSKPIKSAIFILLLFGFLAFAAMEFSGGVMLFMLGVGVILSVLLFLFGKVVTLGFGDGSEKYAIQFKRSVIENMDINEQQAEHVCNLIHNRINSYQIKS